MTQYVINIGALPNDGTGDPLRTAFNEINLNFDQVFAAGPVLSNVRIANNTILTTNTNGNLVLAPNGIGVVQSNVSIVPNTANIRNLGSADRRWATTYMQHANISGGLAVANLTATGNVTVGGNLSVTGNIIYIGNLITDAKTIQLANTAGTANAANGSGITVGANDNIATFLFSSTANAWATNIGLQVGGPITGTTLAVSDATIYGNVNAVAGNFTGNVTANYFLGNGSQLTGLSTSSISNGTSNVNIPTANGNVTVGTAGEYTWTFGTDGALTIPNDIIGRATIDIDNRDSGTTADINLYSADDILIQARDRAMGSTAEGGDINIYAGNSAEDGDTSGGDVTIEAGRGGASNIDYGGGGGAISIGAGDGGDAIGASFTAGNGGDLVLTAGDAGNNNDDIDLGATGGDVNIIAGMSSGNGIPGGSVYINSGRGDPDSEGGPDGNVEIQIGNNGSTWIFDSTGNLTLPSNTFDVNYANGDQVSLGGNTGNVTFDDNIVIGTGDEFGGDGLYLATGPSGSANLQYLRVRGGDDPAHIHFDTGNVEYYDQYFGDDDKYVKLEAGYTGNVVIGTVTEGSSYTWTFGNDGDTTVPGSIKTITTGFVFTSNITDVDTTTTPGNVFIILANGVFGGPETGQVTVTDVVGTTEANNTWYYQAVEANAIQLYNDAELTSPVDGTGWTAYVSGGLAVSQGYNDLSIVGGNVSVIANTAEWTFSTDGNLVLPQGGVITETSIPYGLAGTTIALAPAGGTNADQQLLVYPTAGNVDANHLHLTTGNLYNTELFLGNDDLYVKLANTGNVVINSNDGVGNIAQWTFGANGNLTVPGGIVGSGASPAPYLSGFSSVSAITLSASGNITGNLVISTPVALGALTAVSGARAFVNDANLAASGNFGAQISGGAGNTVPVWSDGTNWYIG